VLLWGTVVVGLGLGCVDVFVGLLERRKTKNPKERTLKEPAKLKTPREGSSKGRKERRQKRKEAQLNSKSEVASHKRQPLHQSPEWLCGSDFLTHHPKQWRGVGVARSQIGLCKFEFEFRNARACCSSNRDNQATSTRAFKHQPSKLIFEFLFELLAPSKEPGSYREAG
jgi:hypothetical protein